LDLKRNKSEKKISIVFQIKELSLFISDQFIKKATNYRSLSCAVVVCCKIPSLRTYHYSQSACSHGNRKRDCQHLGDDSLCDGSTDEKSPCNDRNNDRIDSARYIRRDASYTHRISRVRFSGNTLEQDPRR